MTNYTSIIKSVSLETGRDANDIISTLVDLIITCRHSNNDILIVSPNDGDGMMVHWATKSAVNDSWGISVLLNPYGDRGDYEVMTEEGIFQFALATMMEGGYVDIATAHDVEVFTTKHDAKYLVCEYDVIVLSDGDAVVTYYYNGLGWKASDCDSTFSYTDMEEVLFNDLIDGFRVVFKGYREEVK